MRILFERLGQYVENAANGFLLVRFFLMYWFVHGEKILLRIKLIICVSENFELFALVYYFIHVVPKARRIAARHPIP